MVVWIEIFIISTFQLTYNVTTCVVVWIEIIYIIKRGGLSTSPPAWWCGLKYHPVRDSHACRRSPPAWWCGLKSGMGCAPSARPRVTTCVVVWIEIFMLLSVAISQQVTTCVVVWIEIFGF